jgi:hypothetical protein
VAGFFRTIKNQTYLHPDEVWTNFNSDFRSSQPGRFQQEREMMVKSLEVLKAKAVDLMEDVSECNLHLAENVEYLTCIEVGPEDVPWAVEEESDGESDGGSDDDD